MESTSPDIVVKMSLYLGCVSKADLNLNIV